MKIEIFSLDFRTKFLMTLTLSYTMVLGNIQQKFPLYSLVITLIPILLLLITKNFKQAITGCLVYLGMELLEHLLVKANFNIFIGILSILSMVIMKILPGLLMGEYTILTTNISDAMCSLKKMRCPDFIAIPLTVMVRYFYVIRRDFKQIKKAIVLRGLTFKKLCSSPLSLLEFRVVPLLISLSTSADELTVSAMTKGLSVDQKRSSISEASLSWMDVIFLFLSGAIFFLYVRSKYALFT